MSINYKMFNEKMEDNEIITYDELKSQINSLSKKKPWEGEKEVSDEIKSKWFDYLVNKLIIGEITLYKLKNLLKKWDKCASFCKSTIIFVVAFQLTRHYDIFNRNDDEMLINEHDNEVITNEELQLELDNLGNGSTVEWTFYDKLSFLIEGQLTLLKLKKILHDRGIITTGTKSELIKRFVFYMTF